MIRIRRLEPEDVPNLQRRMAQVVDTLLHGLGPLPAADGWLPRADIHETSQGLLLTLELAGVSRDEIEIVIEGPFLRVAGARHEPPGGECLRWHQMEIAFGPFERVFQLPQDADVKAIAAAFRDGFLQITIPKRTEESRVVPVDVT
jgi:HSP20 family protein